MGKRSQTSPHPAAEGPPGSRGDGKLESYTWACFLQIENLRSFRDDQAKLASADRFYLLLLGIPW